MGVASSITPLLYVCGQVIQHQLPRSRAIVLSDHSSAVYFYSGTITVCAVPCMSMHRHDGGRRGTESGPLNFS
jgi:hypothetical protein